MKLIRFGEAGKEKPGVHINGVNYDVSGFIQDYISWPVSALEQIECLEQLRVLWQGESIHVADALEVPPIGVDTAADLAHAVVHAKTLVQG